MSAGILHPHFSTVDIILEIHKPYDCQYLQETVGNTLTKITPKIINS